MENKFEDLPLIDKMLIIAKIKNTDLLYYSFRRNKLYVLKNMSVNGSDYCNACVFYKELNPSMGFILSHPKFLSAFNKFKRLHGLEYIGEI